MTRLSYRKKPKIAKWLSVVTHITEEVNDVFYFHGTKAEVVKAANDKAVSGDTVQYFKVSYTYHSSFAK